MKGRSLKFCFVLCHCIGVFSLQGVSAMHLVKLSADLQRCPVLSLRDVEPHKQAAAHAEEEEYEEAEALQMLLLDDFYFLFIYFFKREREKREEKRENTLPQCVTFVCNCFICSPQAHH